MHPKGICSPGGSLARWLFLLAIACGATQHPTGQEPAATALPQLEAATDLDGAKVGASDAPTIVIAFASWCEHCHDELAILDRLRAKHHVRILGLDYKGHEEYDGRGGATQVRRYVAEHAPWLRVVPAEDALFAAFGSPSKIPSLYIYDAHGTLVGVYERARRAQPDEAELEALLARL